MTVSGMMLEATEPKQLFRGNSSKLKKLSATMQKLERLNSIYSPDAKKSHRGMSKMSNSDITILSSALQADHIECQMSPNLTKPMPPALLNKNKLNDIKSLKRKKQRDSLKSKQENQENNSVMPTMYRTDSLLYQGSSRRDVEEQYEISEISQKIKMNLNKAMAPLNALRSKSKYAQNCEFPFSQTDETMKRNVTFTFDSQSKDHFSKTFVFDSSNKNNEENDSYLTGHNVFNMKRQATHMGSFPPTAMLVDMSNSVQNTNIKCLPPPKMVPKLSMKNGFLPNRNNVTKKKTFVKADRDITYIKNLGLNDSSKNENNDAERSLQYSEDYYTTGQSYVDLTVMSSSKDSSMVSSPLRCEDFASRPTTNIFSIDENEPNTPCASPTAEIFKSQVYREDSEKFQPLQRKSKDGSTIYHKLNFGGKSNKKENLEDYPMEAIVQGVSFFNLEKSYVKIDDDDQKNNRVAPIEPKEVVTKKVQDLHSDNNLKLDVNPMEIQPLGMIKSLVLPEEEVIKYKKTQVVQIFEGIEKEKHIEETKPRIKKAAKLRTEKSKGDSEANAGNIDRRRFILARENEGNFEDGLSSQKIMFTVTHPSQNNAFPKKSTAEFRSDKMSLKPPKVVSSQLPNTSKNYRRKEKTPMLIFFKHGNITFEDKDPEPIINSRSKASHYKVVSDFTPSQYLQNIGKPVLNKSLTDISDKSSKSSSEISMMSKVAIPCDDSQINIASVWHEQKKKEQQLSMTERLNRLNQFASKNKFNTLKNLTIVRQPSELSKSYLELNAFRHKNKIKQDHESFVHFVQSEFLDHDAPNDKSDCKVNSTEKTHRRKGPYPISKPTTEKIERHKHTTSKQVNLPILPIAKHSQHAEGNPNQSSSQYPEVYFAGQKPHFRRATIPSKHTGTLETADKFNFDPRSPVTSFDRRTSSNQVENCESNAVDNFEILSDNGSAAILPDSGTSSYRLKHDVSFDEGTRYRNISQTSENFKYPANENKHSINNKSSPNPSRMEGRRPLCNMPNPAHVSFKETMPLSLIRMEDRLNEIPLATGSSPVTPTSASTGIGSFISSGSAKPQLSSTASPNGGIITTFRLHKEKPNWNCKLGDLSINGGGFYSGSASMRDSNGFGNGGAISTQMQRTNQVREKNNAALKSRMSCRFNKIEETKCKEKEAVYPDPCIGAAPSFQQRLTDLSLLESETVKYERTRRLRRKKNQDKDS